ncbi:MAG: hypothetical protein D3925_02175 [Candidatus Electrothrix sp. AR5]|nr:hypothetical protein [Candidatus Electrothrix sp. AR5]
MKKGRNIFVMAAALSIIFFTGSAQSADFDTETQNLITQTMEAKINSGVQGVFPDQTIFNKVQNRMMSTVSDVVKQNTAVRKRAAVVETCMECRAMQPLKVVISGQTTLLDADTQDIVNRAMAKKIEDTIREISSDPAVARSVQEKMMKERMATSPLRKKMQPFMVSNFMSHPTEVILIGKTNINAENQLDKIRCSAADGRFPNC